MIEQPIIVNTEEVVADPPLISVRQIVTESSFAVKEPEQPVIEAPADPPPQVVAQEPVVEEVKVEVPPVEAIVEPAQQEEVKETPKIDLSAILGAPKAVVE